MKIIDDKLIQGVAEQAKQSPRLRMNYNFHESLELMITITIIGIPFGKMHFRLAKLALSAFGKEVV